MKTAIASPEPEPHESQHTYIVNSTTTPTLPVGSSVSVTIREGGVRQSSTANATSSYTYTLSA